ncbi:MaoC/PaaZ C-terminal domain-containing protein [Halorubrum ezzemoulense]|uniref:MaoC/PaaZ C-terminal domain-containing protein n=1 Tax=Halorubrum ezzemoulense TaxID=337243 RepID=A0ABT4Z7N3_HALEZ|nr:MaoC/PaaZ C-terminal domain-containing protein [Halorubrum ezzemoulense]MDB2294163.1 MaoC/PaaZ C-terminal domain-containing protein [Halorubrum ezzemoulense]
MSDGVFTGHYESIAVGDMTQTIGRTLTEADVVNYANVTGCWFPVHTDKEFAASTQFDGRVVQGTYLIGLAEGLLFQNRESSIRANAGISDVTFHQPVYIDDTVHYTAKVVDKTVQDDVHGIVTMTICCHNQRDETVLEFDNRYLVARPSEEADTHE